MGARVPDLLPQKMLTPAYYLTLDEQADATASRLLLSLEARKLGSSEARKLGSSEARKLR